MSVYDKAHELARLLRNSSEYTAYLAAKKELEPDATAQAMVKDFIRKQVELQYDAMAGRGQDAAKAEQLRRMYELLAPNPRAKSFLDAYFRFQQMMADVSKIIGESVAEGMDLFANDKP